MSSEILKEMFGKESLVYSKAINKLRTLWMRVKDEEEVKQILSFWEKSMEIVYGETPGEDLFLSHTYLATLVKLIMYLWFNRNSANRSSIDKE